MILVMEGLGADGIGRAGQWQDTGGGSRVDRLLLPAWLRSQGEVSLTGGPHLDPVILMGLADDVLGPDAEAVVPRFPEDVGQVVSCAGHGYRVTFTLLQGEALMLETPAQGQRRAAQKCGPCVQKRLSKECEHRPSPSKATRPWTSASSPRQDTQLSRPPLYTL